MPTSSTQLADLLTVAEAAWELLKISEFSVRRLQSYRSLDLRKCRAQKLPSGWALVGAQLLSLFPVLLFAANYAARPNVPFGTGGLPTGCPKSDKRWYFLVFGEYD